jgi:hypothetical protein
MNGSESHDKQDGVPATAQMLRLAYARLKSMSQAFSFVFFCSMIVYGLRITARSGIEFHQTTR